MHLRLQGKGVFGEGKDRTYGTLMHRILSQIETLDRVDDTIAAFVRSGELSESESKSIREDINRWLADERVSSWFSPGGRKGKFYSPMVRFIAPTGLSKRTMRLSLSIINSGMWNVPHTKDK